MPSKFVPRVDLDSGQVKINDGNGAPAQWAFGDADSIDNQWQPINYALPLGISAEPTTSWPQTMPAPTDADIYDSANGTFLENPVLGQVHFWRLSFEFFKAAGPNTEVFFEIRNTLSGFVVNKRIIAAVEGQPIFNVVSFITIADGASLPPPLGTGQGYEIRVFATNNLLQSEAGTYLRINAITRVSAHYSSRI